MNRLYEHDLNANSLVLEIGAYKGAWGLEMWQRYGCKVVMFEPNPDFFEQILKCNPPPSVAAVNCAVGFRCERRTLIIKGDMTGFYADQGDLKTVDVIPATHVVDMFSKIDLCQINCEGSEFLILENLLYNGRMQKLASIQAQWHAVTPTYEEQKSILEARLRETHHLVFDDPPSKWQIWKLR